jgi:hypothetical protein
MAIKIQICLSERGIDTITSRGKTPQDRADALRLLTRIEPSLAEIDKELESKQK